MLFEAKSWWSLLRCNDHFSLAILRYRHKSILDYISSTPEIEPSWRNSSDSVIWGRVSGFQGNAIRMWLMVNDNFSNSHVVLVILSDLTSSTPDIHPSCYNNSHGVIWSRISTVPTPMQWECGWWVCRATWQRIRWIPSGIRQPGWQWRPFWTLWPRVLCIFSGNAGFQCRRHREADAPSYRTPSVWMSAVSGGTAWLVVFCTTANLFMRDKIVEKCR